MMLKNKYFIYIVPLLIPFLLSAQIGANKTTSNFKPSTVKNSVLSQGTWYKFAIDTTGVFKIDKNFLEDLGINTDDINPKNIQIFGNGGHLLPMSNSAFRHDGLQENAISVIGEEDNRFDNDDYILFYGRGPHSWDTEALQENQVRHINNIYSDKAFYFLTISDAPGKRIQNNTTISSTETMSVNTFTDYHVYEQDNVNLFSNGQQWLGKNLSNINTTTVNFDFSSIEPSKNIFVRVRGAIESFTSSQMEIRVNDQNLGNINFPAISSSPFNLTLAIARETIRDISISSDQIAVEITYNNNGNPSASCLLYTSPSPRDKRQSRMPSSA